MNKRVSEASSFQSVRFENESFKVKAETACDASSIPDEGRALLTPKNTLLLGPVKRLRELLKAWLPTECSFENQCTYNQQVWLIGLRGEVIFYGGKDQWSVGKNLNVVQYCVEKGMSLILHGSSNKHTHRLRENQLYKEIGNASLKEALIAFINGYQFKFEPEKGTNNIKASLIPPSKQKALSDKERRLISALIASKQDEFTPEMLVKIDEMKAQGFVLTAIESSVDSEQSEEEKTDFLLG